MATLPLTRIKEIKNKIKMAEALLEQELEPIMQESISRYIGAYVPKFGGNWDIVLNEVYPIVQNQLPATFMRNPRAYLKPRHKTYIKKQRDPVTGKMQEVQADAQKSANTQESILNYDLNQMKYNREVRKSTLDALLFPYGVLWHGHKGDFGMTEEQNMTIRNGRNFVQRLSPLRWIRDPNVSVTNYLEGDFVARKIDVPLRDLMEDDKLDVDKKLIKGFHGFGEKVGTKALMADGKLNRTDIVNTNKRNVSLLDFTDKDFKESHGSKFVTVYEVFLRPTKKEKREGKKGWILLLTDEQDKALRISDWNIKAEGFPSIPLEFNGVNDALFGLSDVDTYKQLTDQKNVIINMQIANAQESGKTWVGMSKEGASEEDIQAVQEGGNTIVTFESGNPRDRMFIASGAGQGSGELYQVDGRIQQNLDNASGVNDLRRGVLRSGEESAFSVKQRSMGTATRPAFRQELMTEFLQDSLLYLNQLNKQFVSFKDAVRVIGSLDVEWTENISKEDLQADIDVEIDVFSMLPEDPQKELQALQQTLGVLVDGFRDPSIRAKIQQEGKTVNFAPLIEQILIRQKIRDPDVFRNIKPEESEGFVSVQQLRQAGANVDAISTNKEIPFPPNEEDDHVAKLEVYMSIKKLLEQQGQISERLDQIIQVQSSLLQAVQEKEAGVGKSAKPSKPIEIV